MNKEHMKEHVNYELAMLNVTYKRLRDGVFDNPILFNVMHESFCVHARNLVTLFANTHNKKYDDEIIRVMRMIYEQVVTLGEDRTGDYDEKIKDKERKIVYDWIMTHADDVWKEYE